jgi:hypothetical protein
MKRFSNSRRGQALLLVTLSLFAMCGLLGLAVDLGWSYFVKKSAQNAVDAAALAAAYRAVELVGETTPFPSTYAHASTPCPSGADELAKGCLYANQNGLGFSTGGNGGRQNVLIESGVNSTPADCALSFPTAPCIVSDYWVTVRAAESIPQLFSAVLGNTTSLSSSRATAAAIQTIVNGSVITLNRKFDPGPNGTTGIDIATAPINTPFGIVAASDLPGTIPTSGITGAIIARKPIINPGLGDGPIFLDPLRGFGQPPLPIPKAGAHACNLSDSGPECVYAVSQGNLGSTICLVQGINAVSFLGTRAPDGTIVLPSGTYFQTMPLNPTCNQAVTPQAGALTIGPGTTLKTFANGSFGSFFFFGGLNVNGQMTIDPGEYVVVGGLAGGGSLQVTGGSAGIATNGAAGAGEIFILTGSSSGLTSTPDGSAIIGNANGDLYPGLLSIINGPTGNNQSLVGFALLKNALQFAPANIQVSLGGGSSLYPIGLNPTGLGTPGGIFPATLQPFGGIVLWQDQANSTIQYTASGNISLCGDIDHACPNPSFVPGSTAPQLTLPGDAAGFTGTIYQPRGAWLAIGGGAPLSGSLQIITGAVTSGAITIAQPPSIPLRRRVVALIE